jgi:hypothetical protein
VVIDIEADPSSETWDALVADHPARPQMISAWREVYAAGHGLRSHLLVFRARGQVVACCPLVEVPGILRPPVLVSCPYVPCGGLALRDPTAAAAVVAALRDYAEHLGCAWAELRQTAPLPGPLPTHREHVDMVVSLAVGVDPARAADAEARRLAGQAARRGVGVSEGADDAHLDALYALFARRMRALAFPTYPRRFFAELVARLGARVWVARVDGVVAAAALNVRSSGAVVGLYAADDPQLRTSRANHLLHLAMLRAASAAGATAFHLGRSQPGGGTFRYKRAWGAAPLPLYYQYVATRYRRPVETVAEVRRSLAYALARRVWPRLPLAMTTALGPWVIRRLPQA